MSDFLGRLVTRTMPRAGTATPEAPLAPRLPGRFELARIGLAGAPRLEGEPADPREEHVERTVTSLRHSDDHSHRDIGGIVATATAGRQSGENAPPGEGTRAAAPSGGKTGPATTDRTARRAGGDRPGGIVMRPEAKALVPPADEVRAPSVENPGAPPAVADETGLAPAPRVAPPPTDAPRAPTRRAEAKREALVEILPVPGPLAVIDHYVVSSEGRPASSVRSERRGDTAGRRTSTDARRDGPAAMIFASPEPLGAVGLEPLRRSELLREATVAAQVHPESVVHVHIGRLEVNRPAPAAPPPPRREHPPILGLDEYLAQRTAGNRGAGGAR